MAEGKKKNGKKWAAVLAAVLVILLLALVIAKAAGSREASDGDSSSGLRALTASDWYVDFTFMRSYSNAGVFAYDNNLICFYDPSSGLYVPVCDNADCTHNSTSCQAWIDAMAYIITDGEKLLYVAEDPDTLGEGGIYEADLNGTDRRQIDSYEGIQILLSMQATEEWVILSYYNQYDENLELLDEDETGIYAYNRRTGEGSVIWSERGYNARAKAVGIYGDRIYVSYYDYDLTAEEVAEHADDEDYISSRWHNKTGVLSFTGTWEETLLEDDYSGLGYFYTDGFLYYVKEEEEGSTVSAAYYYDLTDGSRSRVAEDLFAVPGALDGAIILYGGSEAQAIYRYTIETGELEVLVADMGNTIVDTVYEDYTYIWNFDTDDGNGVFQYLKTEDLEKGIFEPEDFVSE